MLSTVKLNSVKVKPLITHTTEKDEVLGGDLFIDPFSNCFIGAKKKSGKTTVLYHILKQTCTKGTNVIIMCSTVHKDATYKKILEMLEKKKCNVTIHTDFIDDEGNIISGLLQELGRDTEIDEKGEVKPIENGLKFEVDKKDLPKEVKKKPKKISAEYVLIFDDLGSSMRHKCITQLTKVLRHYKMRTFFLQQYLTDLDAGARKQVDYALIFRSFNEEKLKSIHEMLDLCVPFETFIELYNFAANDYNFLYIDVRNEKYRVNFDKEIVF